MKLNKLAVSHTQLEEARTDVRIVFFGSVKHEKCADEAELKMKEPEWKAELREMWDQIRGMRNNIHKGIEDWERMDVIDTPFMD